MKADGNFKFKALADEREYILFTPMDEKINANEIIQVLEHWIKELKDEIEKSKANENKESEASSDEAQDKIVEEKDGSEA